MTYSEARAELEGQIDTCVDLADKVLPRRGADNNPRKIAFYLDKRGGDVLAARVTFNYAFSVLICPDDEQVARIEAHGQARARGNKTLERIRARYVEVWYLNYPQNGDTTYSHGQYR